MSLKKENDAEYVWDHNQNCFITNQGLTRYSNEVRNTNGLILLSNFKDLTGDHDNNHYTMCLTVLHGGTTAQYLMVLTSGFAPSILVDVLLKHSVMFPDLIKNINVIVKIEKGQEQFYDASLMVSLNKNMYHKTVQQVARGDLK